MTIAALFSFGIYGSDLGRIGSLYFCGYLTILCLMYDSVKMA